MWNRVLQTRNFLIEHRTCLSQASVSGVQSTEDGMKDFGNHCDKHPITREFIKEDVLGNDSYL